MVQISLKHMEESGLVGPPTSRILNAGLMSTSIAYLTTMRGALQIKEADWMLVGFFAISATNLVVSMLGLAAKEMKHSGSGGSLKAEEEHKSTK